MNREIVYVSKDRGAKLSKHAKERLKERYKIVSSVEFMSCLHKNSKKISGSRGCDIMTFDFEGKTIQYVLVEEIQKVRVVKTFLPNTFEGTYDNYISSLDDGKNIEDVIKERNRTINTLNRNIRGLEKQLRHEKEERRKFFDKSFIKAFMYFRKHRKGYLKGSIGLRNKIQKQLQFKVNV